MPLLFINQAATIIHPASTTSNMRLVVLLTIAFTAVSFAQSSCQTRNDCPGDQVCAGTFSFLPTLNTCSLPWPALQIFQIFSSHTTNMLLRPACPAQESLEMFCVEPTNSICAGKGNCESGGSCDVCGAPGDFSRLTPCSQSEL